MNVSMMHDAWNGSCIYDAKLFGNGGTNKVGDSRRCIYTCMHDAYMNHCQMLGKVGYGLPAKIGRLVGCTEMLS